MTSFRLKIFQKGYMRSLTGSTWPNLSTSLLALGASSTAFGNVLSQLEYSELAAQRERSISDWLEHCNNHSLVQASFVRKENLKPTDLFPITAFRQLESLADLDLAKSLEKIVKPLNLKDADIIHVTGAKNNKITDTDLTRSTTLCQTLTKSAQVAYCKDQDQINNNVNVTNSHSQCSTSGSTSENVYNMGSTKTAFSTSEEDENGYKGPSILHLDVVKEYYLEQIPVFHRRGENFNRNLHHKDIVFENEFFKKSKTTRGLGKYAIEVMKCRIYLAYKCPGGMCGFGVEGITADLERGCVRLHWRLKYMTNWMWLKSLMTLSMFSAEKREASYDFIDGISTFYLDHNGKIIKHHLDRRNPLQSPQAALNNPAKKLAAKIAGLATADATTNYKLK